MVWLYGGTGEDSKALSRLLLAQALYHRGYAPDTPIAKHPGGKPYFPSLPDLYHSTSHSGNYALCALSTTPIGVDIEGIRPRNSALLRRALSPDEQAWLPSTSDPWPTFYTLWTLKESRIKQSGEGFSRHPSSIHVPLLLCDAQADLDGLHFATFGTEHWRGAICAENPIEDVYWVTFPQTST